MAGWELLGKEEKKAINRIFDKEGKVFLAHGFNKLRKRFHVREFEKFVQKNLIPNFQFVCLQALQQ